LLNRCKLRVGNNQTVDSGCGGPATVGAVIAHSDGILSSPSRTYDGCSIAQCEDEAINSSDESHSGVVNGPACVHANTTAPCDDGSACTLSDTCAEGACVGGAAPNCNDNNPCTDDSCNPATGCLNVNNTRACNDGYACTAGDSCKNGTCSGDATSPDCAEPKAVDFYRGVCAGADPAAELSPSVLTCVAQWATPQTVLTSSDVCRILNLAPGGDMCVQAEAEQMAALLNLCTGRLKADEPITSSCTDNTTVGQSLADAGQLLSYPSRSLGDCARARCEMEELNSGKAVGTGTLMANRTSQGVRLDWSVPPLPAGLSAPSGFRVWRRIKGTGSFVSIAIVPGTQFDDASVSAGINYEYKVTVVWP
jgi:hypothetical protein